MHIYFSFAIIYCKEMILIYILPLLQDHLLLLIHLIFLLSILEICYIHHTNELKRKLVNEIYALEITKKNLFNEFYLILTQK